MNISNAVQKYPVIKMIIRYLHTEFNVFRSKKDVTVVYIILTFQMCVLGID